MLNIQYQKQRLLTDNCFLKIPSRRYVKISKTDFQDQTQTFFTDQKKRYGASQAEMPAQLSRSQPRLR